MSFKTKIELFIKNHKVLYWILKPLCKFSLKIYRCIKTHKNYANEKSRQYKDNCINNKIGKIRLLSISDLYYLYIKNTELCRYDIIVRLLAVENFFGKNDYGFALYNKMQDARIGVGYSCIAEPQFKSLISSYAKNGYDKNSTIVLDKNLELIDGSHRIAMAIYYGFKNINACIMDFEEFSDYSIDFFYCNGFTSDEINLLRSKENEVRKILVPHFSFCLWSPAVKFKNDIINDILPWGKVCAEHHYSYDKSGVFYNKVRAIYACDDIDAWKVEKKIEYMKTYGNEFIHIDFEIPNPYYRIKDVSNMPISVTGERLKNIIRTKYKTRLKEYFYDILVHTSDNSYQADYINEVCNARINLEEIIAVMNSFKYAIVKTDVPYYPSDFPKDFPVGKDIDVICSEKDFLNIKKALFELCTARYAKKFELRCIESENRFLIRIEKNNLLLLLNDISFSDELSKNFCAEALSYRIKKDSYYILSAPYEYIVRMAEYNKNNDKVHHLEYLKEHIQDYDENLALRHIGIRLRDLIKD